MVNKFDIKNKEKIIETAKQLEHCTEHLGDCFSGELCPVSHSTACCMTCSTSKHLEAEPEAILIIKTQGHCEEPRCFRAMAQIYFNVNIPQPLQKIGAI